MRDYFDPARLVVPKVGVSELLLERDAAHDRCAPVHLAVAYERPRMLRSCEMSATF